MTKSRFSNQNNSWLITGVVASTITLLTACGSQQVAQTTTPQNNESIATITLVSELEQVEENSESKLALDLDEGAEANISLDKEEPSIIAHSDTDYQSEPLPLPEVIEPVVNESDEEEKDMTVLVLSDEMKATLQAGNLSPEKMDAVDMIHYQPPQPRVLFYQFDKNHLEIEDQKSLRQHADFLAVHPGFQIQIHGHSDSQGPKEYNEKLSLERAKQVADALVEAGANPEQIEVFGWGSRDPLLSASQHDKNRRVEFIYLSDQVAFSEPELMNEVEEELPLD